MSYPHDWVTGQDVADRLGASVVLPRHDEAAAASCQFVRGRRSYTEDAALAGDPAVREGTLRYSVLLFKATNTPVGFPTNDLLPTSGEYSDSMSDIYRLIGHDPVVA